MDADHWTLDGAEVRRCRLARKLSHRQVAARIGVHHSTVIRWEQGSIPAGGSMRVLLKLFPELDSEPGR